MKLIFLLFSSIIAFVVGDKEIVCYWGSWSLYRKDVGYFDSTYIKPELCTTIIYAFAGLNRALEIDHLDSWADVDLAGYHNVTSMKESYPDLKVILAVGGWNEGSLKYSVMASTEETREQFATSVLKFLAYYGFDGLDLDWEYPSSRGGIAEDKANFPLLLEAIKDKLSPWSFSLSISVPFEVSLINTGYDISKISELVNYVHVMAYDNIASTSDVTGLSAPMSAVENTISAWIDGGMPSKKLILGTSAYARAFDLKDPADYNVGAAVNGPALEGWYTAEAGFLSYYEVLDIIENGLNVVTIDGTNYAHDEYGQWLTYDNEETIRIKASYVLEQNLGGVMFWAVDLDDFNGQYGSKYPLLTAVNEVIKGDKKKVYN